MNPSRKSAQTFRRKVLEWRSKKLKCTDCKCDPWKQGEDFYVKNSLWKVVVPENKRNGIICIGCFEKRLGRTLIRSDFQTWFHNNRWWGDRRKKLNNPPSPRLCDRMKIKA